MYRCEVSPFTAARHEGTGKREKVCVDGGLASSMARIILIGWKELEKVCAEGWPQLTGWLTSHTSVHFVPSAAASFKKLQVVSGTLESSSAIGSQAPCLLPSQTTRTSSGKDFSSHRHRPAGSSAEEATRVRASRVARVAVAG